MTFWSTNLLLKILVVTFVSEKLQNMMVFGDCIDFKITELALNNAQIKREE